MLIKRAFSTFAAVAVLGLAACGGAEEEPAVIEETPAVDATAPVVEPEPVVVDPNAPVVDPNAPAMDPNAPMTADTLATAPTTTQP